MSPMRLAQAGWILIIGRLVLFSDRRCVSEVPDMDYPGPPSPRKSRGLDGEFLFHLLGLGGLGQRPVSTPPLKWASTLSVSMPYGSVMVR